MSQPAPFTSEVAEPGSAFASGRLTIDLGALVRNWLTVAAQTGGADKAAAVVKADGYGIGAIEAGAALAAAGCSTFFVGSLEEGVRLRRAVPSAAIYVLAGLIPGSAPTLAASSLRPVLGSLPEVEEYLAARAAGLALPPGVHVDTGMNRLGLSLNEMHTLASDGRLAKIDPTLVMSHLACSDVRAHPLNGLQLERFRVVRELLPAVPASLANSAGIYLGSEYHFDLVRPGIALYGGVFMEGRALEVVATVEAQVLQIREGKAGESVGYGATQTLTKATRLAILGVGYADGYHRASSPLPGKPGPRVMLRGHSAAVVGRVSMDLMAVDVTAIPGVERGDWAELFGPNVPVEESALTAGTIGYEFLTGLGKRYARRHIGGPKGL